MRLVVKGCAMPRKEFIASFQGFETDSEMGFSLQPQKRLRPKASSK